MLAVASSPGFSYQAVGLNISDVLFSWITLLVLVCFVVAYALRRSDKKDPYNKEHGTHGIKTALAAGFAVPVVLSPVFGWALAKDTLRDQQNIADKQSITKDYGVEVVSVSSPPSRIDKSTDEVTIKDVVVKVDNAVIECQQYVITASNRYYVTCGENTPLEDLA